jgi:hypothetical protein
VAASCLIAVAISGIFQNGGLSCGNLLIRCSFVVLLKLVSRLRMLDCIAGSVDITLTMNHAYQQTRIKQGCSIINPIVGSVHSID